MPVDEYFASTYSEARKKFLAAAVRARANIAQYVLPNLCGPKGEELAVDVARLGSDDPDSLLMLISGTHGIEGFCGSGCQIGYLVDQLDYALPSNSGLILIHALNPFGFAFLRRVNEDNIDLNRNFQDFSRPLPSSAAYEAMHDWLVPEDWDGKARNDADAALLNYIRDIGMTAFQAAVSSGQYTRPTGLFYGGRAESWSNRTFRQILTEHISPRVQKLAVLDLHSGLGPPGYGEPIYPGQLDEGGFERVRKLYGPEVTSTAEGDAIAAAVTGSLVDTFRQSLPKVQVTFLALEYGTVPIMEVLTALRADHWLYAAPNRQSSLRATIKRQIRDAFYMDTSWWKAAVYGRFVDFSLRASRGL